MAPAQGLSDCPSVTFVEKAGRLRQGRQPAKLVLGGSVERSPEASQEEMCMQLVRFARGRLKELNRRVERRNDLERASALFGDLAMHGAQGLLPGFDAAPRKKQPQLVDDARYLKPIVEDDYIGREAPSIGPPALALAKGLDGGH
jgi:hypothetical protein